MLGEHDLLRGISEDELVQIRLLMPTREFEAGSHVFDPSDESADEMLLVMGGRLSVYLSLPNGDRRRFATVGPGGLMGEIAFITGGARAGEFIADTDVECAVLSCEMLDKLQDSDAALKAKFLANLLGIVGGHVAQIRGEVAMIVD
jgi:CRP-like cAMP-binding protein